MADKRNSDGLEICNAGDYGSEFEYDSEVDRNRKKRADLAVQQPSKRSKVPQKTEVTVEYNKEESRKDLYHLLSLDAYSRHKKFINDYLLYYSGSASDFQRDTSRDKTDFDVLRENHRFLWDDGDEEDDWGKRLAKKYYDKLFKEYCIADLSRYKENKIALRWRIETEVVSGKGQFECGAKRCEEKEGLRSWEVNFSYVEQGQKKNALVKLSSAFYSMSPCIALLGLCPECSSKLNYHHRKKEIKAKRKAAKEEKEISSCKRQRWSGGDVEAGDEVKEVVPHSGEAGKTEEKTGESSAVISATTSSSDQAVDDANIWTKPLAVTEEKSREDEFDEYFEDMFL